MARNNDGRKPHAIMIPYPYQGHINPFVHLAIKLASQGFIITFVNTHSVHHQISKAQTLTNKEDDIFAKARQTSGLDIRYATVNDGFPLAFDRSLNHDQFVEGLIHVFSAHVDELVQNLVRSSDPPPTCLIADTFYVWPSSIAAKYNLVFVSFWTEPALVFTLYYHLDLLKKNGHFAAKVNRKDKIDYIPGVEAIEQSDLMSYLRAADVWTVVHRVIYKAFEGVKKADIIICNTVQELETETLAALHQKQPAYSIGPVFGAGFKKNSITTSLWSESDCSHWLNNKPNGSVVYVSFGSHAHTSKEDIAEIAHGIAMSGVKFIWVLRPDIVSSDETDVLPAGFEEKIKKQGLIVPWCCQIQVLSHPAVGGFLTHCGWNSILESIWCCKPMICFPLVTDQFTNRKLVVNDWKIGINLCDKERITKEEVADKVNLLMSSKTLEYMSGTIKQLRKMLENAVSPEGSSARNLNEFVENVKLQIQKRSLGNGIATNGHISKD